MTRETVVCSKYLMQMLHTYGNGKESKADCTRNQWSFIRRAREE